MKIYGLSKVLSASQSVVVKMQTPNGTAHRVIRLELGKTYELPDDPYFEESLANKYTEVKYAPKTEEYLKEQGVDYEIILCKSCGGKVKKLKIRTAFIEEVDASEWEKE